jgi:hypothetical protein
MNSFEAFDATSAKRLPVNGYIVVKYPSHPKAWKNGYVYEHRVVVENDLGRYLDDDEIVHHINGDRSDNSRRNLMVKSRSTHSSDHGRKKSNISCPVCYCSFYPSGKYGRTYCSTSCYHRASEKIDWPTQDALALLIANSESMEALARQLGVSSNAIRKRCRKYCIDWNKKDS